MDALKILEREGVSVESMVQAGFSLYVGEESQKALAKRKKELAGALKRCLADPNIALLIDAATYLDGKVGPESSGIFRDAHDPSALVADELIGMSIAEYIAGKRGLFNYVRYDKAKPGILAKLPPFLDDAVAALVAGCMTRVFEE
jgi:alpha-ribazole phosphatase CobZ